MAHISAGAAAADHAFPEPTEAADQKYSLWLIIFQFFFFIALLGPAIVGIGVKVTALQEAGEIGADGRAFNSALAVLGGFGAFFATVANVVFGRISDRTTGKWGRRRPWILVGTAIMTVGLAVMASGPTLMMATVGWSIAQLGANMALAPFIATIADQVPKFQRGKITALLGIAQNAGIVGGVYVASWFGSSLILMFVLPAVVAIVVAIVFCLVLPDQVLPAKPPRMTLRDWAETFWVNPAKYPDFSFAWWSRFLITFASFGFTTFRFAYMGHHLGVESADIPALIANTTLVYTGALMITAWIAGMLSDRLGRRKVFVWTSTAFFALGTFLLIHINSVAQYYLLEILLGAAYGVYIGVDLALVVDVLPNPDDAGKDLGVFNIANALPQTFAPMIGGIVLAATGGADGGDYTVWFTICAIACLVGALVIIPIKKVK